ncbi:RNA-directed DNA polymerase, eukaryota, reverse transcriptase zinc-binding domain protein [Tanacetum coccineum]
MGNGVDIRFWEDKWRGDNTFQSDFPRMYALETQKNISVALKLSHDDLLCSFRRAPRAGAEELQYIQLVKIMEGITLFDSKDRWRWSLEGCGEFTVASVRNLLDANSLPVVSSKTRWIKAVPIKVNIHAWKVKLDILPTRLNISKRGMDIESILCPLCEKNVESSSHIFFTCPISREIFRKVLLWWEIDVVMVSSYDEPTQTNIPLWTKIIKGIHGEDGKIGKHVRSHHLSLWLDIVKEVQHIQRQGTDLLGFIHRKMGNGVDIRFWEDKWRGDNTFQSDFPRMYALETQKNISVALKLSHDDLLCSFRRAPRAGAEELQYI